MNNKTDWALIAQKLYQDRRQLENKLADAQKENSNLWRLIRILWHQNGTTNADCEYIENGLSKMKGGDE